MGDDMYLSPRYFVNIENKGQHPSLQIFFELMSHYHIFVDQFLFGDTADGKSMARRLLDALTDELTDRETGIIIATVQAVGWRLNPIPEKTAAKPSPMDKSSPERSALGVSQNA